MNPYRDNSYREPPHSKEPFMYTLTKLRLLLHIGSFIALHLFFAWCATPAGTVFAPLKSVWLAGALAGLSLTAWAITDLSIYSAENARRRKENK